PTSRPTSSTTCAPAPGTTPSSSPRPASRSSTRCGAASPTDTSTRSACPRPPSPATAWPRCCRSSDPMEHGILTDHAHTAAAGADYIEPTVLGSLLVQDADGTWQEAPPHDDLPPAPSFAVIAPADLGLSDPAADPARIERHLRLVMTAAARRARPGATVVLGSGAARRTPDGVEPARARAQLARSVRLARDLAAEH